MVKNLFVCVQAFRLFHFDSLIYYVNTRRSSGKHARVSDCMRHKRCSTYIGSLKRHHLYNNNKYVNIFYFIFYFIILLSLTPFHLSLSAHLNYLSTLIKSPFALIRVRNLNAFDFYAFYSQRKFPKFVDVKPLFCCHRNVT